MKLRTIDEICPDYTSMGLETDLEGWNSDHELFGKLIARVQPKTIIEVGTWKGKSALHMASLTTELKTNIYCCDTWLGEVNPRPGDLEDDSKEPCMYNPGQVYYQFLHNAVHSGMGSRIYPVINTSINAARLLYYFKIKGDLIYIDASHEYDDVYQDLTYYFTLLAKGGVLFGDDYKDFPGVRMAVNRFAFEQNLRVALSGPAWVLQPQKAEGAS